MEERVWRLVRSSWFALRTSESWAVRVSNRVVMAAMPETVAQRMERMEPSVAVMDWRTWGDRSCSRSGLSWRLFLVSEKICARKARGREGREEGDSEECSWRQGALTPDMAAAKA